MKKATKKVTPRLVIDQFQKIKKSQIQPNSKSSYSTQQRQPYMKIKIEEAACKFCKKYIPEANLFYHQQTCQVRLSGDYYEMIYPRPQLKQREGEEDRARKVEIAPCNDDYYPQLPNDSVSREKKNTVNKSKRPMSAMNKKIEQKQKPEVRLEQKQSKLKKATSTSKLKEETKYSHNPSREKGEKGRQPSKYEHIYLKNIGIEKKHPLSIGPSNNSKLKKKNVNMVQRFLKEERSIEQKPLRRPDSRSKKEEKPAIRQRHRFEESSQGEEQQIVRRKHKEQVRLDPPQITTQKLREMVREKLKEDKEEERERRRDPQHPRRQNVRDSNRSQNHQQRQPLRTEVRNQREPQRQSRQPRPNRNQTRNRNFQRYPRRQASNRNEGTHPQNFLNLVSQTINNQLEMIKQSFPNNSNQFSVMSNIFQNFSNFVNINIESHPNYYQFTTHQFNSSSSSQFDSDSYSSEYDDYFQDSEPEGMDEEQLKSIQNKRYRVEQHGQNQCTICLAQLKNGDIIKQLFCDHLFHAECIEEWLRRKSACPVCRDQLGNN